MSKAASHPSCEHHHLAAARHVAAAYHHLQAIEQYDKGDHEAAKAEATSAHQDCEVAHNHATKALAEK
jgi:hypothetical protein